MSEALDKLIEEVEYAGRDAYCADSVMEVSTATWRIANTLAAFLRTQRDAQREA